MSEHHQVAEFMVNLVILIGMVVSVFSILFLYIIPTYIKDKIKIKALENKDQFFIDAVEIGIRSDHPCLKEVKRITDDFTEYMDSYNWVRMKLEHRDIRNYLEKERIFLKNIMNDLNSKESDLIYSHLKDVENLIVEYVKKSSYTIFIFYSIKDLFKRK